MATAATIGFKDGKKRLIEFLKPPMREREFAYLGDLSFGRGNPREVQTVSFGARRGRTGELCFSFGAGVRFPQVEAILNPQDSDRLSATIAKPLSVLKPVPGFPEWCSDGQREPESVIAEVMHDIDEYALPFLAANSSMEAVVASLELDDPRQWFVLSPEQRLMTLVVLEHVLGRGESAQQRLHQAIEGMSDAPLKKRWPIEKLRERLMSAG